jgi:hypothetical protein
MDLLTYLTTSTGDFGGPEWGFFVVEIAAALAGIYLAFLRNDTRAVRGAILRRGGLALGVLGALGTLFGALRLAAVEPLTMPIWFYAVGLVEILLAAYTVYYWLARYPAQQAVFEQTARSAGRRGGARPQPALQTNGNRVAISTPRPEATTGRRDSRRDRKRRGR